MEKLENSNRLFVIPIIAILILGIIFMIAVLPRVNMNPKNVPIGLVVTDEGEMGDTLSEALLTNSPELVKFKQFDSIEKLEAAMDEREVYGALVLPTNFSSKVATLQSIMPFFYGLVVGYAATWYATWLLDFEFGSFNRTALFIAICVTAFTFMIFATLRWLKLPSIVIFVLLMFFSMAAVQLAPEMMPSFYRDYIISWLPLRFFVEGLREVLFFSHDVINSYSVVLIMVLVVALVLVWIKNLVEKTETKQS